MENPFQKKPSKLDDPIDRLLLQMSTMDTDDENYDKNLKKVERLMKLQGEEPRYAVDPNTLVTVAGSLLGILTIVAYEQKHVMVSKALGLVTRSK